MSLDKRKGRMSLRRFFRLLMNKNWQPPVPTVDDSLAKTVKDALDIRSRPGAGGAAFPGTSQAHERIAEGHENYAKSFKKKDS